MLRDTLRATGLERVVDLDWLAGEGEESIVNRAWNAALYPFKLATSRTAIKVYLTSILFLVTSFILLSISTSAYGIFYYNYIPPINLERPVYLQYDVGQHPQAEVPLRTNALISQQAYDIAVVLHMPRTPNNLAAGNFMLDLTLHTNLDRVEIPVLRSLGMNSSIPSSALHRSRRPAILPYESRISRLSSTLLRLPFHLLALHDTDSITLTIPMFEELQFARGKDNIPSLVTLEIQSQTLPQSTTTTPDGTIVTSTTPHLQIYSASITFQARFHGLRRIIYNHRIIAFAAFTSLFYIVSISTLGIAWALVTAALSYSKAQQDTRKRLKREDSSDRRIKTEPSDAIDPLKSSGEDQAPSDTPTTFPRSSSRSQALHYTPNTGSQESSQHPPQSEPPIHAQDVKEGEAADDEEDASEDEWEQLQRLRERMMQQQQQALRERGPAAMHTDSGIGTSMDSAAPSNSALVRRRSQRSSGSRGRSRE